MGLGAVGCASNQKAEEGSQQLAQNPNWPIEEGGSTPKLCMRGPSNPTDSDIRRIKQLGVTTVVANAGAFPWSEQDLRAVIDRYAAEGMSVANMFMGNFVKIIYGVDGREEEIQQVKDTIRAAGSVNLPVLEYDWYTHRLIEGYYGVEGRGGAIYTGFDYDRVKDLPAKNEYAPIGVKALWENLEYFLKEVIPVAEEAGVRLALHPNDPPVAMSRGSDQILVSFDDFKRLVNLVDSPANGMTCHPGYYAELGIDGLEVIRYLGERDRINHCHYRNVRVQVPSEKFLEVFPDNGEIDMLAMMREIIRQGYTGPIFPEHPRVLDYDREHPKGIDMDSWVRKVGYGGYTGWVYNIAYARAMMQASLMLEGRV